MTNKNISSVMETLDLWVSRHGNGKYFKERNQLKVTIIDPNGDAAIGQILEEYGIQQVRSEIEEFSELLLSFKPTSVLEIGLGRFGSTHFLWRQIFDKVVTIEKNFERVRDFGRRTKNLYGRWVLDDGKSFFVHGMSNEPSVVMNTYRLLKGGVDVLFIDGDHTYQGVLTDWLLYAPLVKPGGIVAFHDSAHAALSGAPKLIEGLSDGTVDGRTRTIKHIIKSDVCGIGYYTKEAI